jgi:hypothetical protein
VARPAAYRHLGKHGKGMRRRGRGVSSTDVHGDAASEWRKKRERGRAIGRKGELRECESD